MKYFLIVSLSLFLVSCGVNQGDPDPPNGSHFEKIEYDNGQILRIVDSTIKRTFYIYINKKGDVFDVDTFYFPEIVHFIYDTILLKHDTLYIRDTIKK